MLNFHASLTFRRSYTNMDIHDRLGRQLRMKHREKSMETSKGDITEMRKTSTGDTKDKTQKRKS